MGLNPLDDIPGRAGRTGRGIESRRTGHSPALGPETVDPRPPSPARADRPRGRERPAGPRDRASAERGPVDRRPVAAPVPLGPTPRDRAPHPAVSPARHDPRSEAPRDPPGLGPREFVRRYARELAPPGPEVRNQSHDGPAPLERVRGPPRAHRYFPFSTGPCTPPRTARRGRTLPPSSGFRGRGDPRPCVTFPGDLSVERRRRRCTHPGP